MNAILSEIVTSEKYEGITFKSSTIQCVLSVIQTFNPQEIHQNLGI